MYRTLFFTTFLIVCGPWPTLLVAKPALAILQGATTDHSTQLTVLHQKDARYTYTLQQSKGSAPLEPSDIQTFTREFSGWASSHLIYNNLFPNTAYTLRVTTETGNDVDERTLKTFPSEVTHVSFAVASCVKDVHTDAGNAMWRQLLNDTPDLILLIGDNVYVDARVLPHSVTGETIWNRYVEVRLKLDLFRSTQLTPILATWDDHDFGYDNANREFPYKEESKEVFEAFFAQAEDNPSFQRGPGVSSIYLHAGHRFVLLDDRTFRSPSGNGEAATHLGDEQERWVFEQLSRDTRPTFLINGNQFFGGYHSDESFQGSHPVSFSRFLDKLMTIESPVMFISGDIHHAELMQIPSDWLGYPTYEITSSGIHMIQWAPLFWLFHPNPYQVAGSSANNYAIVTSHQVEGGSEVTTRARGHSNRTLFEHSFYFRRIIGSSAETPGDLP